MKIPRKPAPGELILHPKLSEGVWPLLVLLAVWPVALLATAAHGQEVLEQPGYYWGLGVLALFTMLAAVNLLPGANVLWLTPEGVTVRHLFLSQHIPWENVERVYSEREVTDAIVISFMVVKLRLIPGTRSLLWRVFFGNELQLPSHFGRRPDELATILEGYRKRAGKRTREAGSVAVPQSA